MEIDKIVYKKINSEGYIKEFRNSEFEIEVISRMFKKKKENILDPFINEEQLDPRTLDNWIKKRYFPIKSHLEKIRELEEYPIFLEEVVEEITRDYERRKLFFEELNIHDTLKQSIIKKEFESELQDSGLFWDEYGSLFILKKLLNGIATDEIESRVLIKKINDSVESFHLSLIDRIKGLNFNQVSDIQYSKPLIALLDLYEKYPDIDIKFNNFFSKQFYLFEQLIKGEIGQIEFSIEMEKLMSIVYEIIKLNNKYDNGNH
jgi:hypothetical protein